MNYLGTFDSHRGRMHQSPDLMVFCRAPFSSSSSSPLMRMSHIIQTDSSTSRSCHSPLCLETLKLQNDLVTEKAAEKYLFQDSYNTFSSKSILRAAKKSRWRQGCQQFFTFIFMLQGNKSTWRLHNFNLNVLCHPPKQNCHRDRVNFYSCFDYHA